MAATDERSEPPLLSWKGMQLWSVGYRAPAICEIFMGLKAKKFSSLISHQKKMQKKGKRKKQREGDDGVLHLSEEDADLSPARCSSLELPVRLSCRSSLDDVPHRHSVSIECSGRISNQLKRNSDATASHLKRNSDNLRRNSDAALNHLQHLSFSPSPSSPGGYERVWVLEGAADMSGGLDCMLPKETKLGGRRSDVSAQWGRQDSSISANHRASCASFSSSTSVTSATSAIAKLVHASRRSSASGESEQRHLISQLLVGNQFLTHLTAAPVPSAAEQMLPSDGLLLDASIRCREAELKDRIIFFL